MLLGVHAHEAAVQIAESGKHLHVVRNGLLAVTRMTQEV